jgi:hypothetical protein
MFEADLSESSSPSSSLGHLSVSPQDSPTHDPPRRFDQFRGYPPYGMHYDQPSPGMLSPHAGYRSPSSRSRSRSRSTSSRSSPYPRSHSPSSVSASDDDFPFHLSLSDTEDDGNHERVAQASRRHSSGQITKPLVASPRVIAASAGRRKANASFLCDVCGDTLTSKKNYEGRSPRFFRVLSDRCQLPLLQVTSTLIWVVDHTCAK